MEMRGERVISAPKEEAWNALFDPDVLRQCIPGCESVERISDTQFKAAITLAVGPVKAKFSGDATLSEINAPDSCKLTGKGSGGIAGFGKGEAWIKLADGGNETRLTYEVKASVGGKPAQVGQRLIDSTAQKLAEEFFSTFVKVLENRKTPAQRENVIENPAVPGNPRPRRITWWPIAVASGLAVAAGTFLVLR